MSAWTTIPKPTDATWSTAPAVGHVRYNQPQISYSDSSTLYDGGDPVSWTNVAKPTLPMGIRVGMITGLMMPLTYNLTTSADDWHKISKPTS